MDRANVSTDATRFRRSGRPAGSIIVACVLATVFGCGAPPRAERAEAEFAERAAAEAATNREGFKAMVARMIERIDQRAARSPTHEATLDLLALSGGGDYGAFGAGFLVGWGSIADPEWKRPEFDAISGVSTGALISPFAYAGTDADYPKVDEFYRNPKSDWVQDRGALFFLPYNPSFMTIPGLERDVRAAVDMPMVARMAEQSRQGRVLAVGATDLDMARQHVWNIGGEAEAAVASGSPKRVQDMLLSSAAIPAVFPPIEIDGSIYADGGVTANVLLRLDAHSPDSLLSQWRVVHPDRKFPKTRYWIIINNQMNQPPRTVQVKWPAVVAPSLATAIRCATLAEVRWLSAEADYVNSKFGADIEIRVVAIPDEWRAPVKGDFKKESMESLSDLGRKMGADPSSWQRWTGEQRSFRKPMPEAPTAK